MADPFVGEIRAYAFNFPPQGWAYCNGALVSIGQYQALYAILGTHFGGNGSTTFGLPNLQGRAVVGVDPANRPFTTVAGSEGVALTATNCVAHTHTVNSIAPPIVAQLKDAPANNRMPTGQTLAAAPNTGQKVFSDGPSDCHLDVTTVGVVGSNTAANHENRQPFLTVNFCIAVDMGNWPYQN